ncbi:MAG: DUF4835 family protein [Fluviicola sp.]
MNGLKKIVLLSLLFWVNNFRAQELNCQVTIITDVNTEVTSAEKELFEQLKRTIYDFMNSTKWTDDKFKVEERINCQLQLQINTINNGNYTGSLQIQSSRPVFNGSYSSTIFNFQDDDFEFQFNLSTIILFAPNQFRDNLSSILAFYAYYIIGLDYDTFSLKGGTPYFLKAQEIVSNAQSGGGKGWKSNEQGKRNRYWLMDNCLQQLFEPLRECFYEYHRNGLDQLYSNQAEARKAISVAMNQLTKVSSVRPGSINLASFVQGKTIEIKNLFSEADQAEKTEIVNTLKKVDPVNSSRYEEILL